MLLLELQNVFEKNMSDSITLRRVVVLYIPFIGAQQSKMVTDLYSLSHWKSPDS